jgi:hypothetical protein
MKSTENRPYFISCKEICPHCGRKCVREHKTVHEWNHECRLTIPTDHGYTHHIHTWKRVDWESG